MAFKKCIDDELLAGRIDADRAAEAKDLFDRLEREFLATMTPEAANFAASKAAIKDLAAETVRRNRLTELTALQTKKIDLTLDEAPDMFEAALSLIERFGSSQRVLSLTQVQKATLGRAHAKMGEAIQTFRRDLTGRSREKGTLTNVLREAFGEDTGDELAKRFAQQWDAAAEFNRGKFNALGGNIGRLPGWGIPTMHNSLAVRVAKFKPWRDNIMPRMDRERMIDGTTGRPFSAERLEVVIRDVYETIKQEGLNKITSAGLGVGKKLANRRADHRFLIFKSADDWLEYMRDFGDTDISGDVAIFEIMMSHLNRMSHDIAQLEVLGPNPVGMIRHIQQRLLKEGERLADLEPNKAKKHLSKAKSASEKMQVLFEHFTGEANSPANPSIARAFQEIRRTLVSAKLGSAAISAITDFGFGNMAARFSGIPQAKLLARVFSLYNPANQADRNLAVRSGLIAEDATAFGIAQQRYVGELMSEVGGKASQLNRILADDVLRVSGLSGHTQIQKWAFGMEFMGLLSDQAGRSFDELDAPLRRTLERYRIGPDKWDIIRTTEKYREADGGGLLRPEELAARTDLSPSVIDDLTTRMLAMIQSETEFAVPTSSIRGRAAFLFNTKPGTFPGEAVRSSFMFKNFAVTLYFTHIRRMVEQPGFRGKAFYGAQLFITSSLLGAMALQLKEIAKGKDPEPMFDKGAPGFWLRAIVQGGGLGIYGDFFSQDFSRFGQSLGATVAGPVAGAISDAFGLTGGNLISTARGDDPNFQQDLVNFMRQYTPGGSIWYLRSALDRNIFDQLELAIDPDAKSRFRRSIRKARRDRGQGYFYKPGERLPSRLPDLENILAER